VGLVYLGVLSGLSTAVQLYAPQAYRGRVISFFQVALGVSYPIGALVQGPVADAIGIGWTTACSAAAMAAILVAVAVLRPDFVRALTGRPGQPGPAGQQQPPAPPVRAEPGSLGAAVVGDHPLIASTQARSCGPCD
jgi:hypothetical protein